MKWGLCQVLSQWFEGSQTERTQRWWYDGQRWVENPVNVGPFNSEQEALAFVKKVGMKSCFAYYENDPFGTQGT